MHPPDAVTQPHRPRRPLEGVLQDLRFGARLIARDRGLTAAAVLTLALGIGASTALFSVIDALMLRALPVESPRELFVVGDRAGGGTMEADSAGERDDVLFSNPLYRDLRERNEVFSGLAALSSFPNRVYSAPDGEARGARLEVVDARLVSGNFFDVLGVRPALGRLLTTADDDTEGGHAVAVISHGFWKRRFGASPAALGAILSLSGTSYEVVGVAAERFTGVTVGAPTEVWVPLAMQPQILRSPSQLEDGNVMWLRLVGRLRPGVSAEQAEVQLSGQFRAQVRDEAGAELTPEQDEAIAHTSLELVRFDTGFSGLRRRYAEPLKLLFAVVGLVLLIACANVGGLLLARGTGRQREIALRLAMGSSHSRIVRQLLTESLLLAVLAGGVALIASRWFVDLLLVLISSSGTAVPLEVRTDARVLGFALAASLGAALLFGLAPALATARVDLITALRSQAGVVGSDRRGFGLRRLLVVSQVAVSLLLLIGAGLFLRSLGKLTAVDPGFEVERTLVVRVDPQGGGYPPEQLPDLYRRVVNRVEAVPGVEAASFSLSGLFSNLTWRSGVSVEGHTSRQDDDTLVEGQLVTPSHRETMGIPLLRGRFLSEADVEGAPPVAVVNETFARRFFGGGSPVGRRFGLGGAESARDIEIVGMVADIHYHDLRGETPPVIYLPVLQSPEWLQALEVRTTIAPRAAEAAVAAAVRDAAPGLPMLETGTLEERVRQSLRQESVVSRLTAVFGLVALALAAIGLYGVLSYAVARRTAEIGLRVALGARRAQVSGLVLTDAVGLVGAGLVAGLVAALLTTRFVSGMVYGLDALDPAAILGAMACLAPVAGLTAWLPARRAARLDPLAALRQE